MRWDHEKNGIMTYVILLGGTLPCREEYYHLNVSIYIKYKDKFWQKENQVFNEMNDTIECVLIDEIIEDAKNDENNSVTLQYLVSECT